MDPILNARLTLAPWTLPALWRLPGTVPLALADWLTCDDAYAAQMAERQRLIASAPVHALMDSARPAAEELYDLVLGLLPPLGFRVEGAAMLCPDGRREALDRAEPLLTLGRLVQQDFCLLQKEGEEHVLTGAILCFPASWTLGEKLGRPMTGIHVPVAVYDEILARRVQRLMDGMRPEQPLYRMNAHLYADPALFQPQREAEKRPRSGPRPFLRTERQCFVKLPGTGAVVFSIHTQQVAVESLTPGDRAALEGR